MGGTGSEPVPFGARIRHLGRERAGEAALVFAAADGSERHLRWRELDRASTQVAHELAGRGVGAGDRLSLGLPNCPELVVSVLAAWKLGAVPVPVRWDLPDWERARVLEVIGARVALEGQDLRWLAAACQAASAGPEVPALPEVAGPQTHGVCSSGSTGLPKVILIDRPALWDPSVGQPFPSAWGEIARPQVLLVPGPLYHTNGFATLLGLLGGDRLVLMERFDAARALDLVEAHRVTAFTATPTMLQRIAAVDGVEARDLSSLVWVLQGAAVLPEWLGRRWIDLLGPERFFMAYGMTEGLGLTALRGDEWLAHPGSVGRGYRDTEVRILDPEGREVPAGEVGDIYLRSPTSGTYRYLGGAPRLARTADGFETAGDLGRLDEDGYLYVLDRRQDLIVTGGANVYPAEVESALCEHPGVADVVVVGLRDPEWGRRVHAIVEPVDRSSPPTAEELIAFAKARLAAYKAPKTVELIDSVPRTAATKVSRAALVAERGG